MLRALAPQRNPSRRQPRGILKPHLTTAASIAVEAQTENRKVAAQEAGLNVPALKAELMSEPGPNSQISPRTGINTIPHTEETAFMTRSTMIAFFHDSPNPPK